MLFTSTLLYSTLLACAPSVVASPRLLDVFSNELFHVSKRASTPSNTDNCKSGTYSTPIGLNYKVSCGTNIPLNDLYSSGTNLTATDVYDCARQCSTARGMCFGASYNVPGGQCWLKNINITTGFVIADGNTDTVILAPTSQMSAGYDTACPGDEGGTQTTVEGMEYTLHCNRDINGYNLTPLNTSNPFPWHASSLANCMSQCATAQPLCSAVSYFPQMSQGYANCYPKAKLPSPLPNSLFIMTTGAVVHSGVANIDAGNNTNCRDGTVHQAAGQKTFVTMCNQDRDAVDIARSHAGSLSDCISGCATYSGSGGSCIAAVYDSQLTKGWQNCMLKNSTGAPLGSSNGTSGFVFARLSNIADNSTSTSGDASDTSSPGSKAWIAAPVVGIIIAIAATATIFFIVRRRRRARVAEIVSPAEYGHDARSRYNGYAYEGVHEGDGGGINELSSESRKFEMGMGRVAEEKFELAGEGGYGR